MGQPAQFFVGIIFQSQIQVKEMQDILMDAFGSMGDCSEIFPFVDVPLSRIFMSFKKLRSPLELVQFKKDAMQLENEFFRVQKKQVANLDPGYLDATKIVLASAKQGGHKMALDESIYATMILDYYRGTFRAFDWTFADFKSGKYFPYFEQLRRHYLERLGPQPVEA